MISVVSILLFFCVQVLGLTISEEFELFNTNSIANNKGNSLSTFPVVADSGSLTIGSTDSSSSVFQVDYNGFVTIKDSNDYLTVNADDNNKLGTGATANKSHIFFITSGQFHFDQFYVFVACPTTEDQYDLYVNNDKFICPGDQEGILITLRPVSTISGEVIDTYVPDILETSQGVQIAAGSSISYVISQSGLTTTLFQSDAYSPSASTASSSSESVTLSSSGLVSSSTSSFSSDDKTTTVFASHNSAGVVSLSTSYKLSTYYSTTLVPFTSTYTTKDGGTLVIITTIHTTASSSECHSTLSTGYTIETVTVTANSSSSSSFSLLTTVEPTNSSISLLTTRLHSTSNDTTDDAGSITDSDAGFITLAQSTDFDSTNLAPSSSFTSILFTTKTTSSRSSNHSNSTNSTTSSSNGSNHGNNQINGFSKIFFCSILGLLFIL